MHDHVYAIGTVNFTGDMPVVLMVDGPSLGGFVCPLTVTSADLWKMGQARPGDTIRFVLTTLEQAYRQRMEHDKQVASLRQAATGVLEEADIEAQRWGIEGVPMPATRALLHTIPASSTHPGAQYRCVIGATMLATNRVRRLAGDRCVFVEYGPMTIDLALRIRVTELQKRLASLDGLVEVSPGVRSALVEYDPRKLSLPTLLEVQPGLL